MNSGGTSRRSFLGGLGGIAVSIPSFGLADAPGVEPASGSTPTPAAWAPVSDRRVRVGIAGCGHCKFGAMFGFQDHPNVEVVGVTDLIPERCDELASLCRCRTRHPSLEAMLDDDRVEAVFVATDAPSHARHCIAALRRGKHVATAVPAVFGSLEDAEALFAAVRSSGRVYMMFETSCFREDLFEMRRLYEAGCFGRIVYAEGEYYHYCPTPIPSFKEWRVGLPPLWYPTHATAYYVGVGDGWFTEVSCLGMRSRVPHLQPDANSYRNPLGTEIALLRTGDGGSARMAVSWDTPGYDGEMGRVRGSRGAYYKRFVGLERPTADLRRPPLPPGVEAGGHGGSHGYLMNEFVMAILQNRRPLIDVAAALNMTVPGIVAHASARKDGEWMKVPRFVLESTASAGGGSSNGRLPVIGADAGRGERAR